MTNKEIAKHRLKNRTQYLLALVLFIHSFFFLIYWLAVGNFRGAVDQFVSTIIGFHLSYTSIMMIVTVLIGIWSLFRIVRFRFALRHGTWKPSVLHWVYFVLWITFLFLFYGAFWMILKEDHTQKAVLFHLLDLTRLGGDALLFLFAGIVMRRLILFLRGRMQHAAHQWTWALAILLVLICLVGFWLIPAVFPPSWAYQGDLPAKPALIAHRGASMLAPENTLAAAELASNYDAFGFETDIRISLDGEPFLMHDDTLARTTNIAEVFPERVDELASNFTMEELKTLNAGLWFIQQDPFGTIRDGKVSQSQLGINQGQSIPTLTEALELVGDEGLVVLFDLRYPAPDHPFFDEVFSIVLSQCRESGLNEDIWFLVDQDKVSVVLEQAPQFTRVLGVSSKAIPDPDVLLDLGYEIVNVDTGISSRAIRAYREQRLGVNVYTIDQPWLFSQFWLSGVTSVTTNNVQALSQMDRPLLNVPYSSYLLFWGFFGIIVAIWLASSQPDQRKPVKEESEAVNLVDSGSEGDQEIRTASTSDSSFQNTQDGEQSEEVDDQDRQN